MRAEQLISHLRQLGPPFASSHLMAALHEAARQITRLGLNEKRVTLLVLNRLIGEQIIYSYSPAERAKDINEFFVSHVPQQIYVNGAQAIALAFVAGDLHIPSPWERCYELSMRECADDLLLEWCSPEIDAYCYVLAADSTGRALLARAPTVGGLTGTFRVESDYHVLEPLIPVTITAALRMSAAYCWPN